MVKGGMFKNSRLSGSDRAWLTKFVDNIISDVESKSKPSEKKALDYYRLSQSFYKKSKKTDDAVSAYKNKCIADALYKKYTERKIRKIGDFFK